MVISAWPLACGANGGGALSNLSGLGGTRRHTVTHTVKRGTFDTFTVGWRLGGRGGRTMWEDEGQDEQGEMASRPLLCFACGAPFRLRARVRGVGLLTRHSYRWSLLTELDACGGDGRRRAAMGESGQCARQWRVGMWCELGTG